MDKTKELTLKDQLNTAAVLGKISCFDGSSDALGKRLLITFKNGLKLSIVRGQYTYGGRKGLFEIAVFNTTREFMPELFDVEDQGDDVLGYLTLDRVNYYLAKIANYEVTNV